MAQVNFDGATFLTFLRSLCYRDSTIDSAIEIVKNKLQRVKKWESADFISSTIRVILQPVYFILLLIFLRN